MSKPTSRDVVVVDAGMAGAACAFHAASAGPRTSSLIEIPTVGAHASTADAGALEALRPAAEEIVTAAAAGDLIALRRGRPPLPSRAARPRPATSILWRSSAIRASAPGCTA